MRGEHPSGGPEIVARRRRAAEADRRDQRLAALDGDRDDSGVDALERSRPRRASGEHLVEVDRAAELAERRVRRFSACARSSASERSRTIACHPLVELSGHRGEPWRPSLLRDRRPSRKTVTARAVAASAAAQAMTIVVMAIEGGGAFVPRANCIRLQLA